MQVGGLDDEVWVHTDAPLLWTTQLSSGRAPVASSILRMVVPTHSGPPCRRNSVASTEPASKVAKPKEAKQGANCMVEYTDAKEVIPKRSDAVAGTRAQWPPKAHPDIRLI
ncbi:hypothetical protein HaLaN_03225, partial [Haematococcus lacustris]